MIEERKGGWLRFRVHTTRGTWRFTRYFRSLETAQRYLDRREWRPVEATLRAISLSPISPDIAREIRAALERLDRETGAPR